MSGFFDDSHVTGSAVQGSLGRSVGFLEMVQQGYRQQYRVDSALALNNELQNRWLESLRAANISNGEVAGSDQDWAYVAMAQHVKGQPIEVADPVVYFGKDTKEYRLGRMKAMIDANEAIKKLNNPNIKSFEQILEEVAQMQHEVEGKTASMWERSDTGGVIGSFVGAMGGSFTVRDPLNLATMPLGFGRTIAMRIAVDMGIAAAVVGTTEYLQVAPAREIVDLPERDPLFNILASAVGAGVIRGGLEGVGYGVRRLRGDGPRADVEDIDFDLRDSQLAEMFAADEASPSARAGERALEDISLIERNNPYGEGRAAQERFLAELREIQRVMGGEPMTAVARVLPPMPFESIKKAADFEIVREQAPQLYARMEAAQAKVTELQEAVESASKAVDRPPVRETETPKTQEPDYEGVWNKLRNGSLTSDDITRAGLSNIDMEANIIPGYLRGDISSFDEFKAAAGGSRAAEVEVEAPVAPPVRDTAEELAQAQKALRTANKEYQAAYREVEGEAVRIRDRQAAVEATQQREAVNVLADATPGRAFNMSLLTHDNVQARVDAINAFTDTLDERVAAMFIRQLEEGTSPKPDAEPVEREAWQTDTGIDIGLRDPVDPDFRVSTDDGEMTVKDAMRDLQDDADLDDAMRTCLI